jgi:hypothetical protein
VGQGKRWTGLGATGTSGGPTSDHLHAQCSCGSFLLDTVNVNQRQALQGRVVTSLRCGRYCIEWLVSPIWPTRSSPSCGARRCKSGTSPSLIVSAACRLRAGCTVLPGSGWHTSCVKYCFSNKRSSGPDVTWHRALALEHAPNRATTTALGVFCVTTGGCLERHAGPVKGTRRSSAISLWESSGKARASAAASALS